MNNRNRLLLSGLVVLLLAALTASGLMLTRGSSTRSNRVVATDKTACKPMTAHTGKCAKDREAPIANAGPAPVAPSLVRKSGPDEAAPEEDGESAPGETTPEVSETPPVTYQVRGHFKFSGLAGLELSALAALVEKETLPFELHLMNGNEIEWSLGDSLALDGKLSTTLDADGLPLFEDGTLKTGNWVATVALLDGAKSVQISAPHHGERLLDFGDMNIDLRSMLGEGVEVVTGRLIHSSGTAMVRILLEIKAYVPNPKPSESGTPVDVTTDTSDNGTFLCLVSFEGRLPSTFAWTMGLSGSGGAGSMKLPPPAIAGPVIDFGSVTFQCAIVELSANGWIADSERLLKAGPDATLEDLGEPVLHVEFSAFEQHFSGSLARSQSKVTLYVAPGNYQCTGQVEDGFTDYEAIESSIEVPHGGSLRFTVCLHKASPRIDAQPAEPSPPATQSPPREADPAPGKVRVILPKLPAQLSEIALVAIPRFAGAQEMTLLQECCQTELWEGDLPPGSWDILLTETRSFFGYENGVVSGPSMAEVVSNANIVVLMPGVGKPLWKEPVHSFAVKFTCEGQAIGLCAPFAYRDQGKAQWYAVGTSDVDGSSYWVETFIGPRQEISLADGNQEIEIAMAAGKDGVGSISHDFPCRVEVRFSRGGKRVAERWRVQGASGKYPDLYQCEATATDRKPVLLWLPPGKATISISRFGGGDEAFSREVEVKREGREVVEFDLDTCGLAINWAERYKNECNTNWLITDSSGRYVGFASHSGRFVRLEPGSYSIAPWYDFSRKQAIGFTVAAGSDTEIDLPYVDPIEEFAEVVLPYPQGLRPDSSGYYCNVGSYPIGFGDMETARPWMDMATLVGGKCTAEGVVMYVPVGVEFVVFAAVANYDREQGGLVARKSWCMTPRRMKVTSTEKKRLGNLWSEGVALATSWDKVTCDFRMTPGSNPLGVYYDKSWRVLPDGGYKLTWETPLAGGKPLAHTFLLDFSSTMGVPNKLPDALKLELEEAGFYKP